jgi:hypothetical protein
MSVYVPQGRHGWQGPQGLGLAWIFQNRKQGRQRPCLPKIGRGGPVPELLLSVIKCLQNLKNEFTSYRKFAIIDNDMYRIFHPFLDFEILSNFR